MVSEAPALRESNHLNRAKRILNPITRDHVAITCDRGDYPLLWPTFLDGVVVFPEEHPPSHTGGK